MNYSLYKIYLDVHKTTLQTVLNIKRNDTGRKIIIGLTSGGKSYPITEECIAVFRAKKPDGTVLYNHCEVEDNLITYELTAQTSATEGIIECEVTLYGTSDFRKVSGETAPEWKANTYYSKSGTVYTLTTQEPANWETNWTDYYENAVQITSPRFCMLVDDAVQTDDEIESENEFSELLSALARLAGIELHENTRERNEAERKAAELERVRNENQRIANENARKSVFVRYTDDPDEGELSPTKEEGMNYFGLYNGKTASTNISDYQWFNVEGDIDDIIEQVLEYAKDTGINGWKFTKDNQNRCFLISNTNKTYLIDNGTIGCEKIILYDSTGYIEVDIDSFKSDNITPVYHEDTYGHLMEVQDSTINEIPTKEWVMNYVGSHGGGEASVSFVNATINTYSSDITVTSETL